MTDTARIALNKAISANGATIAEAEARASNARANLFQCRAQLQQLQNTISNLETEVAVLVGARDNLQAERDYLTSTLAELAP